MNVNFIHTAQTNDHVSCPGGGNLTFNLVSLSLNFSLLLLLPGVSMPSLFIQSSLDATVVQPLSFRLPQTVLQSHHRGAASGCGAPCLSSLPLPSTCCDDIAGSSPVFSRLFILEGCCVLLLRELVCNKISFEVSDLISSSSRMLCTAM